MSERNFHAEAVGIVATWWHGSARESVTAAVRECESRLRAEHLIRQMLNELKRECSPIDMASWVFKAEKYLEGK